MILMIAIILDGYPVFTRKGIRTYVFPLGMNKQTNIHISVILDYLQTEPTFFELKVTIRVLFTPVAKDLFCQTVWIIKFHLLEHSMTSP